MQTGQILNIIWIIVAGLFVLILIYIILILAEFKRGARSISNIIKDTEQQYTPLLSEIIGSTSSIKNIIGRVDKISRLFLSKFEIMADGSQKIGDIIKKFIKSPVVETKSFLAGVKKAIDVLLRR